MHPKYLKFIRSLHPLGIFTHDELCSKLSPISGGTAYDHATKKLKVIQRNFPIEGDQHWGRPLGHFGFRWISSVTERFPQRPVFNEPMDTGTLALICPDLAPKLSQIGIAVIEPHDIHAFLVGVYGWEPQDKRPRKPQRKLVNVSVDNPIHGKGIRARVFCYE
jgi:hypothetical protein